MSFWTWACWAARLLHSALLLFLLLLLFLAVVVVVAFVAFVVDVLLADTAAACSRGGLEALAFVEAALIVVLVELLLLLLLELLDTAQFFCRCRASIAASVARSASMRARVAVS